MEATSKGCSGIDAGNVAADDRLLIDGRRYCPIGSRGPDNLNAAAIGFRLVVGESRIVNLKRSSMSGSNVAVDAQAAGGTLGRLIAVKCAVVNRDIHYRSAGVQDDGCATAGADMIRIDGFVVQELRVTNVNRRSTCANSGDIQSASSALIDLIVLEDDIREGQGIRA